MKVILLRDVAKIGRRFEVVNVPDGYALNLLIPKKDAEPATPANLKRITEKKAKSASAKETDLALFKATAERLCQEPLNIKVKVNDSGHLFQSIHISDVVSAAKDRGVDIAESTVVIEKPIKEAGEHKILLKLQDVTYTLPILVKGN